MAGPVVFISHFAVKEGRLDDLRRLADEIGGELQASKRETVAYLMYLDEDGSRFTVAHCFPSDDALATMRRGAEETRVPLTVLPDHVGGFLRLGSG